MNRKTIRKYTFLTLFQIEFQKNEDLETLCNNFFDNLDGVTMTEEDKLTIKERVIDVSSHLDDINKTISDISEGWNIERIGKVELSILRVAVYEIKYDDLVPSVVAINEAVELAKKYGGDSSSSYINAVLAKLV